MKLKRSTDYIPEPRTIEEAFGNVEFQFDNVRGWVSCDKFEAAIAKLDCLIEASVTLREMLQNATGPR